MKLKFLIRVPQSYKKDCYPIMSTPGNDIHIESIVYVPKFIYIQRLDAHNRSKLRDKSEGISELYWIPFPEYKQL